MKLYSILATLCLLFASLPATLPQAYTAKGNPQLYQSLAAKAKENLSRLDSSQRKSYQKLLKQYDDILMHYLIAYEEDSQLQIAVPQWIECNYLQIKELLESQNPGYEPEFFLSYVAQQTVADERIQAYRKALLADGLADIKQRSNSELELYRELCKWCLEKLVFQPTSGRDQSPMDIAQKSFLGRCEEMQILFVAAARTVGLPARPASTPWWAHTDNNHAWAEVWLEDAWHYTGDMDAAYYPDQTWFSGMIDKTVLILARGSLESHTDEVLSRGSYQSVINSTRNYAKERCRQLDISVLDDDGSPASDAGIGIFVFNWGALRPLSYFRADAEGKFSLSVGRGAFYVLAFKDQQYALAPVQSSEDTRLELSLNLSSQPLPDQQILLAYPSNPFEWKQAPQSWNDDVATIKQRIADRDRYYQERAASLQEADSLYWQLVSASRANELEFRLFASRFQPVEQGFLQFLQEDDPKALWQMTAQQFEALYRFYLSLDIEQYSDEALHQLVSGSVYFEELPQPWQDGKKGWRLFPTSFIHKGKTDLQTLSKANRWLNKKYKTNSKKALSGLLPLNLSARRKYLSPLQKRMLMVCVARANGIPAAFARLPNLINVLLDDEWQYWDLQKAEIWSGGNQGPKQEFELTVKVQDENGLPLPIDASQLMLTRLDEGNFYSLNYRFLPSETASYTVTAPTGSYYLQMGYRISDAQTGFLLQHIDASSADSHNVLLQPQAYPRSWQDIDPAILALMDTELWNQHEIILIGSFDHENSVRSAEKLRSLGKDFLWLGYNQSQSPPSNYRYFPAWHQLVTQDQRNSVRTITLKRSDSGWQMFEGIWDKLPE